MGAHIQAPTPSRGASWLIIRAYRLRWVVGCTLALFVNLQQSFGFVLPGKPPRKYSQLLGAPPLNGDNDESIHITPEHDNSVPRHVAFVCDGNSRWARKRGLPVAAGHAAGADRLVDVVLPALQDSGVQYCTMYGFSTENWKRSDKEIREIFTVMEQTAHKVCDRLLQKRENLRVCILGDLNDPRIPTSLRDALHRLQTETYRLHDATIDAHTLCLAVNYGGRQDILEAAKKLARAYQSGEIANLDTLSEDGFSQLLSTADIPDPDLVIRTSGECRLSNFLTWNTAYAELYFTDTLWPDFDHQAMAEALAWFAKRKRRFGARVEA